MAKNDNLKDYLTDLADAIREKEGSSEPINPQDFSDRIKAIKGGMDIPEGYEPFLAVDDDFAVRSESQDNSGFKSKYKGEEIDALLDLVGEESIKPKPTASAKAVNFRDYDGTVLYSYTKDEFLALKELPPLPTREGLICQEWNWDYADAKEYVQEYGVLEVGATYITDDGKTRLYISIAAEGRMDVPLRLQQSVSNGVVVDWGDGSATETFTGTFATILRHTYGKVGDYVITLEVLDGTLTLEGSSSYGIFADSMRVYGNMLQKVEVGNGMTTIGEYAFRNCYSLASVVIPNSVTSIGNNAFYYCYSLASVVIPNSVTSIGNNAFYNCYSLASVVIPNNVTSIGSYAFNGCFSLASVVIPNNVTSIVSYAFYNCYSLASVVIPNNVTSIGNNAFYNCYSLASVVIPNNVTSIGNNALNSCTSLAILDFRTHTSVPTLSNTNAFSSFASDCKIVVPDALYDTWIAATNWSTYASKIIKASEFNG